MYHNSLGGNIMKKSNSLQVLRAIAFLGIFTSHLDLTRLGGLGVEIFLIMSGFLMYLRYSYHTSDRVLPSTISHNYQFSKGKICKLYPLHIITLITALPILFMNNIHKKYAFLRMISKIVLNVLLLQAWIPIEEFRYSLNNLSWYLCVCCVAYFFFPYILTKLNKIKKTSKVLIISISLLICQILIGVSVEMLISDIKLIQGLTYNFPLYRCFDFALGCNLGWFYKRYKKEIYGVKLFLLVLTCFTTVITIVLVPKIWYISYLTWCKNTVILLPASCLLVLSFFMLNLKESNRCILLLIKLGDISAYTYLIHELVIRYINIIMRRVLSINSTFANKLFVGIIALFITVLLALFYENINWRFYETRKN